MVRVGMLGGTFDPPHNAHLAMAETAMAELSLDRVLFLPAPDPPHKSATTPYETRVELVRLAIGARPGLELSRLEEGRTGPSYTVDLLEEYRALHDDELFFIMGSDSLMELNTWKRPDRIVELATLVVFLRPGYDPVLPAGRDRSLIVLAEPRIDVSSSNIRARIAAGEPVAGLLPEAVHQFILDNSLYSC